MKNITYIFCILIIVLTISCSNDYFDTTNNPISFGQTYIDINISTDKAIYNPGETVHFKAKDLPTGIKVRYTYLGEKVAEQILNTDTWSWTTPNVDFRG